MSSERQYTYDTVILDDSQPAVYVYDAEIKEIAEKALEMAKHKPKRVIMVDYSVKGRDPAWCHCL
ncbi:MAG: hypothetical protein QMC95_03285 [Desulfitobacteriaceae bacterium]|nr:hypothetical protein [Desulfitobacteriaceae bacterium]MDI6913226.1 hypothetical protein [Desulfitobacteriaceae bacterium]